MHQRGQWMRVVAISVVLGMAAAAGAQQVPQAPPVVHSVVGELTGCKDPAAVANVVAEINTETAEYGGPTGQVWRPFHHRGWQGRVVIVFRLPSLSEYGTQTDRVLGAMRGDHPGAFQKLSACIRIVERRADQILVSPSVPLDAARVVDRLTYRRKGHCSAAEVVQQVRDGNAWLRAHGYPGYGLRWPVFGAETETIGTYAGYASFTALTQSMAAFSAEAANPDSAMAQLWTRVSACLTLTSRMSVLRVD